MQAITLDLNKSINKSDKHPLGADIRLSLRPFIEYVEKKAEVERSAKVNFFNYILAQFKTFPELKEPIPTGGAIKYRALFELIYTALSPIINDEKQQYWAISTPISPCFHFGTDAFYSVLMDAKKCNLKADLSLPSKKEMEKNLISAFYNLIMERFYNFSLTGNQMVIHSVIDPETHLLKYYRLNIDTRFIEVKSNVQLPEYNIKDVRDYINDEQNTLKVLTKLMPPENFSIEGFSIVTLVDVTDEYALETVKNLIINQSESQQGLHTKDIATALKTLVGTDHIDFGMIPYIKLNNKVKVNQLQGFNSVLLQVATEDGFDDITNHTLVDNYLSQPRTLIFPDIKEDDQTKYPTLKLLGQTGIKSYAIFPLYYNGGLVGCLEMYTKDSKQFSPNVLSKIEAAFPLLAQLYHNVIVGFNNDIQDVIMDKFTALQPSVQWRFHEAAYNYVHSGARDRNYPIEPIFFKDVIPLYAAIDIRNSSIQRNAAIRRDLYAHFEILEDTLNRIRVKAVLCSETEIPSGGSVWSNKHLEELSDREIFKTEDYLQRQIPHALQHLKESYPEVSEIVDNYFKLTGDKGKILENRERYEKSMQMINVAVTRHLDEFNAELQNIYPCYFEKFRTDGVEFDLYLGQSITPGIQFPPNIVHDFRLRQLSVLAEIARTTNNLGPYFSIPLETTQLIFVYEKLIDISFRIDEQRFDVEGSYNIRYQMVKKRIDKALIKDTTERLTQPGKIAIVYFDSNEAKAYQRYIKKLQGQRLLNDDLEFLELEELQGVEGLKALRVGVKY